MVMRLVTYGDDVMDRDDIMQMASPTILVLAERAPISVREIRRA